MLRSNYLIIGIKLSRIGEVDKANSVGTDVIGKTRRSSINTPETSIIHHLHNRIRAGVECLLTTRIFGRQERERVIRLSSVGVK